MVTPGRSYSAGSGYRFGFIGYEKLNEVKGENISLDFGARVYDTRLGRFASVDPKLKEYPFYSPYLYFGNNPIAYIDFNGEGGTSKDGNPLSTPDTRTTFSSTQSLDKTGSDYSPWEDLIDFYPAAEIIYDADNRIDDFYVQNIDYAKSDMLNLDYYSVTIDKLPTGFTDPEAFLEHIRKNLGSFITSDRGLYSAEFEAYDYSEGKRYSESETALGSVMTFKIYTAGMNVDDGSVMVSTLTPQYWSFTTVHTDSDDQHPVSGNRQFGIVTNYDVSGNIISYTLYTRGADRPSGAKDTALNPLVFAGADDLWKNFINSTVKYVQNNGGSARSGIEWSKQISWQNDYINQQIWEQD